MVSLLCSFKGWVTRLARSRVLWAAEITSHAVAKNAIILGATCTRIYWSIGQKHAEIGLKSAYLGFRVLNRLHDFLQSVSLASHPCCGVTSHSRADFCAARRG